MSDLYGLLFMVSLLVFLEVVLVHANGHTRWVTEEDGGHRGSSTSDAAVSSVRHHAAHEAAGGRTQLARTQNHTKRT